MPPTPRVLGTSEVDILSRALDAEGPALSASAARSLLGIRLTPADLDRMNELSEKAREGTLTDQEQIEIDNYERAGHVLSLLKLKARLILKRPSTKSGSRPD